MGAFEWENDEIGFQFQEDCSGSLPEVCCEAVKVSKQKGMRSSWILDSDTHRMFSEVRSGVRKTGIKNDKVSGLGKWKEDIPVVRWGSLRNEQL